MEDNVFATKLALTGVIATGTALWGWFGWLALLWAASMALDYITGTLAAVKAGEWSSGEAREGLWHKGGMILVVLVTAMTDGALTLILQAGFVEFPFEHSILLTVIALSWYTLTELGSTLENLTKITDRVPRWLTRILKIASEAVDAAGDAVAGKEQDDEH